MTNSTGADDPLEREVDEAFRPVVEDVLAATRRIWDALGGAEGISELQAAIEQAKREKAEWEAAHPGLRFGQHCHCWCTVMGHHGVVCDEYATTFEVRMLAGEPVQVPLCQPCADQPRSLPRPRFRP